MLCNYLQNVAAITYIFVLQLSTFLFYNKQADNWILIRVHGSHYQYRKVGISHTVIIPNHNGKDLSIGVVKDLEKKTGLSLRR